MTQLSQLTDMSKAVARGQNLIVRQIPPEEATAGGIIIPDKAREHQPVAEVLAMGPAAEAMSFGLGDIVLYPAHATEPLPLFGDNHFYLDAADVVLSWKQEAK